MRLRILSVVIFLTTVAVACSKRTPQKTAPSEYQKALQTQLISAQPGDVITISAGVYEINRGLSLNMMTGTFRWNSRAISGP